MTEKVFLADIQELNSVIEFTEQELEGLDCPMKAQMQITIAVEEIFVNIANYAYGGEKGQAILEIEKSEDGGVILCFKDQGRPFNPLEKPDPDISLGVEERGIGGLGILMVKKTMDRVEYTYENGQNILRLWKHF